MIYKNIFLLLSFIGACTTLANHAPVVPFTKKDTRKKESEIDRSFLLGFSTLSTKPGKTTLKTTGTIPTWLKGSFVTVGPNQFEVNSSCARYWVDGFAALHQFTFDGKNIVYQNKVMDNTAYYQEAHKKGHMRHGQPEKKQSTWSKLYSAVAPSDENTRPKYDNTNVNVIKHNGKLVALTETPHLCCLDEKTLKADSFSFDDDIKGHFNCAHPIYDSQTKEWYNYITNFAHNSDYIVYKVKDGSTKREAIATIPAPYPSYMHSFALTKKYIILTEIPFVVSPYDLLLSDTTFIDTFSWKPKQKTQFIVIDKQSGKLIGKYKTDAFFALHHANAFEKDGKIIIDIATYPDNRIINALSVEAIKKNSKHQFPQATLKRFTIDLKTKKVMDKKIGSSSLEFPRYNQNCCMKDYHYLYATAADNQHHLSDKIVKIDVTNGTHMQWHKKNCFPSEPIFIAKPQAQKEDDGILLSVVLDCNTKTSFLVVLDAQTMQELGTACVPHHIPFTMHGNFIA